MTTHVNIHFAKKPDLILELFGQKKTEPSLKQDTVTTDSICFSETSVVLSSADTRSETEVTQVNMHVSSKHLTEASPYFETLLNGNFSEGATSSARLRRITLKGIRPAAFALLMNILHHRTKSLANQPVDSEILYQVCVLVDMYTLHEHAVLYTDKWFDLLSADIPDQPSEELDHWIFITYVLGKDSAFQSLTCVLQRNHIGTQYISKTPLPSYVEELLQATRNEAFAQCMKSLYELLAVYENSSTRRCLHHIEDCDALVLGALIRSLKEASLYRPSDDLLRTTSIRSVLLSLDALKTPSLCGRIQDAHRKQFGSSFGNSGPVFGSSQTFMPKTECGVGRDIETIASTLRSNSKGITLPEEEL